MGLSQETIFIGHLTGRGARREPNQAGRKRCGQHWLHKFLHGFPPKAIVYSIAQTRRIRH